MDGMSDAKQTLLRALEQIEEAEEEAGGEVRHVGIVYSVHRRGDGGTTHEVGGWSHPSDPDWLIAALLRRGANSIEDSPSLNSEDDD